MKPIQVIAFTSRGTALCERICAMLPEAEGFAPARYKTGALHELTDSLADWTKPRFRTGGALVFVGAAGIAVRAIAPYVRHKSTDPAVVVIDEAGRHVIPLLSGHIGGANRLAKELASLTGGEAVLTTATDVNGVFSPDAWAAENGCAVADTAQIKHIAAALLDGEPVGIQSEFPVAGALPEGVIRSSEARCGIAVGLHATKPFEHTLHLVPRCLIAGIGCRRDTPHETIEQRLRQALDAQDLPMEAVGTIASIDLKSDEAGLLALGEKLRAPLVFYSAEELAAVEGAFTPSERVARVTGVDNVCERAAVLAGGTLLSRKYAGEGVTIALAKRPWKVIF